MDGAPLHVDIPATRMAGRVGKSLAQTEQLMSIREQQRKAEAARSAQAVVPGVVYAPDVTGASASTGAQWRPGRSRGPFVDGSRFVRPNTTLGRTRSTSAPGEAMNPQRVLRRGAAPYLGTSPDAEVTLDGTPRKGSSGGVDDRIEWRTGAEIEAGLIGPGWEQTPGVTRRARKATMVNLSAQLDRGNHLANTLDPVTRSLSPDVSVRWSNASTPRPGTPEVELRVQVHPDRRQSLVEHFAKAKKAMTQSNRSFQTRTVGKLDGRFVTGAPTLHRDAWTRLQKQSVPRIWSGAKLAPLLLQDSVNAMRAQSPSRGYGAIGHNARLSATWRRRIPSAKLRPATSGGRAAGAAGPPEYRPVSPYAT